MALKVCFLGAIRRRTFICCRNVQISASSAARDRNRSTTVQPMSLKRSLIEQQHRPILGQPPARFRAGTRRASPVAWHVLVTVLSLPPRRGEHPYRSVFGCSCGLRPPVEGSALGDTHFRGHNAFTFVTAR